MDVWRTTTPRKLCDTVITEKRRDCNGNTVFTARVGLAVIRDTRDFSLTEVENHLNVALQALQNYSTQFECRLLDFRITDQKHGLFVFERLASE